MQPLLPVGCFIPVPLKFLLGILDRFLESNKQGNLILQH